jgi:hypothetical protein
MMKRRNFLKSTLTLGGAAAATSGLTACSIDNTGCTATDGAVGPLAGFKRLGQIQPKSSDQVSHSYWGIQAGAYDEETLAKASAIGVHWTRVLAGWAGVEKEKGQFSWSHLDTAIDSLLKFGITPFVTLTNGNAMYTGIGRYDDPKLAAIYGDSPAPPVEPEEITAWLAFVSATIERYKDRIVYWEIWNEPNHRKYWGGPPNAVDYGNLVRVTSEKIRALHPGAKIIAGSTAGISPDFHDGYLGQCDPALLDIISFHNYGNRPEERVYRMPRFREVLDKYNPQLEVWQGECGIASQSRTTGYRGTGPWGPTIQAKWLLRQSFVDTWFCGATLSNYFKLFSNGELEPEATERVLSELDRKFGAPERNGSRMHALGINEKCIINTADRSPKPAYYAYQNLCAAVDSRYKKNDPEYAFEVIDPGSFAGIGEYEDAFPSVPLLASFKSPDAELLALWLPWIPQEAIGEFASVSLNVESGFTEPVLLDLLSGEVYAVDEFQSSGGSTLFGRLPLADYPLIIAERGEISTALKS